MSEYHSAETNSRQSSEDNDAGPTPPVNTDLLSSAHRYVPYPPQIPTWDNGAARKESDTILLEILETLQNSTIAGPNGKGFRAQFWAKYKKIAEEHDNEFLERYNGDMDIVLIFSGLFSAVSTSFIVAMESNLTPDPSDKTNALLTQLVQIALGNTTATTPVQPAWLGPTPAQMWIQTIAYASLSTSLLAAFGAVLGKQWLGFYKSRRYGRGSLEEQSKRRQVRLNGIEKWYFHGVVQSFPVLIQISLLLFGIALSAKMWFEQQMIASVIIGMTALGFLIYTCTVIMSLISPACPFQTPVSIFLRLLIFERPYVKHLHRFQASFTDVITWTGIPVLWQKLGPSANSLRINLKSILGKISLYRASMKRYIGKVKSRIPHIKMRTSTAQPDPESGESSKDIESEGKQSLVLFVDNKRDVNTLEVHYVRWLLETSTDPEAFLAAARMVPEIEWPQEVDASATFGRLVDTFIDCFDLAAQIVPDAEEAVATYALAISHIFHQSHLSDRSHLRNPVDGYIDSDEVHQCWTLYEQLAKKERFRRPWEKVLRHVKKLTFIPLSLGNIRIDSENNPDDLATLPTSDLVWLLHMLMNVLFVQKTFYQSNRVVLYPWSKSTALHVVAHLLIRESPPLSPQVVANCAMLVGCVIGVSFDLNDIRQIDKSPALGQIGDVIASRLYAILQETGHGRHEQYSNAKKCLASFSEILHLSPPPVLRTNDSEWFYSRHLPPCVMELADEGTMHASGSAKAQEAHAAFRIAIVVMGGGRYQPDDLRLIRDGSFNNPSSKTTNLLVELLFYLCEVTPENSMAIGGLLLVLNELQGPRDDSTRQRYLTAITICMAENQPEQVRYAALRAVFNVRWDILRLGIQESVGEDFSRILLAVMTPDKPPEQWSSNGYYYFLRYEYYSKFVYTLTRDSHWAQRLSGAGHTQRCVALMSLEVVMYSLKFCLCAAIVELDVTPLGEQPWLHLLELWALVVTESQHYSSVDGDVIQAARVVARFTIECIPEEDSDEEHSEAVEKALHGVMKFRDDIPVHAPGCSVVVAALDELVGKLNLLTQQHRWRSSD